MKADDILNMSPNLALLVIVGLGIFCVGLFHNRKTIKELGDGFYNKRKRSEEYKKMIETDHDKTESLEAKFDDLKDTVDGLKAEMQKIAAHVDKYDQHREEDRAVSIQYRDKYDLQQEQTMQVLTKVSESIDAIGAKIDENQKVTDARFKESEDKNNKRIRAELKNEISEIYRRHHRTGKISSMALEVLENLIEEYEEALGDNSFVHSIVQKEMYSWELVDDID